MASARRQRKWHNHGVGGFLPVAGHLTTVSGHPQNLGSHDLVDLGDEPES